MAMLPCCAILKYNGSCDCSSGLSYIPIRGLIQESPLSKLNLSLKEFIVI